MREVQSQLVEKIAAVERYLKEAATKGAEAFKQSEAFHQELLPSCREVFFLLVEVKKSSSQTLTMQEENRGMLSKD